MKATERGLTLTEVLIASTLALVVVIGIGSVDVARVRIDQAIREEVGLSTPERLRAALAALQVAKQLEGADRAVLATLGGVNYYYQFRIPELDTDCPTVTASCPVVCTGCTGPTPSPCCFDIATNYRWVQYRWDPTTETLKFYDNTVAGCNPVVLSTQTGDLGGFITSFRFEERLAPPGGNPQLLSDTMTEGGKTLADNNVVHYYLEWRDSGAHEEIFEGEITLRGASYSNVNVNCPDDSTGLPCDSGTGLDVTGVSPPPAVCL